jgi:TolB-like protein/Flp pilus assembly protein TadD
MIRFKALGTALLKEVTPASPLPLHVQPKTLALLAYLCIERPGEPKRRDRIVFLLWPDLDQDRARAALNQTVHRLRRKVGADTIVSFGQDELVCDADRLWCDVIAMEHLVRCGRTDEALNLYAGDLMEGFHLAGAPDFERWLADRREMIREEIVRAAMDASADAAAQADLSRAIQLLRRALQISPLEEDAVRDLILLLDRAGDPAAAIRSYELFALRLDEEYGLMPAPETRRRAESIRARLTASAPSRRSPSLPPRSILVLPFRNPGNSSTATVFCDGLAEEVLGTLGRIERIHVIARTSAFELKGGNVDPVELAGRLGVDSVLEGSVQVIEKRVRIHTRLLQGSDGALLWSRTYDRMLSARELFAVQAGVARAIAHALEIELDPEMAERLTREPTEDLEAYSLCVRGRHAWSRRSPPALEEACALFRGAIERDPSYAVAWAGLADTLTVLPLYASMEDGEPRREALDAATRAVELDEGLAEAHAALARALEAGRRWEGAGHEYRRAIELNPNYAPARYWYASHLLRVGSSVEGLLEIERAVLLDPLSPAVRLIEAFIFYLTRQYAQAIHSAGQAMEMELTAEGPRVILALSQTEAGLLQEAVETAEELQRAVPDSPRAPGALAYVLTRFGDDAGARFILADASLSRPEPLTLAMAWTALGELDDAFRCLEKVDWDTTNIDTLLLSAAFDQLRADPRYGRLRAMLDL